MQEVSDSIIVENITKKVGGTDNQFEISYVGFDKSSNTGRLTRNLVYTDYRKPHFALSQELRFSQNETFSLLDYISAEDCIDGDVSPFITVEGAEAFQNDPSAGIYDCTVSVSNSVGDPDTQRTAKAGNVFMGTPAETTLCRHPDLSLYGASSGRNMWTSMERYRQKETCSVY